jgi:hypothetical protein
MSQATETDRQELKAAIQDMGAKIDVGFTRIAAEVQNLETKLTGEFQNLETKFTGEIQNLETKLIGEICNVETRLDGELKLLATKLEERTRLGFWGFIFRGVAISLLGGGVLWFTKFLFWGTKLLPPSG